MTKRNTYDKEAIHRKLMEEIEGNVLKPGTPLSERSLVERFGISRTPIREVLWMLERDGLIEFRGNRGAFVTKLGATEVIELFQLREALEPLAAMLAANHRPTREAEELLTQLVQASRDESLVPSDLVALGSHVHDAIAEWSGNRMLKGVYETLRRRTHLLRNLLHDSKGTEDESLKEHIEILKAIVVQDAQSAYGAMAQHLKRARLAIIDDLFSTPESAFFMQAGSAERQR